MAEGALLYITIYGLMILFFSYFWVATQFNELQIADDLKKNGGYIPGVRPGQATSDYLHNAMSRITLAGAIFLTIIAVIPILLYRWLKIPYAVSTFFGGTSMLILVGVLLDTMRQMETHLLMRHYDGFLKKGRLRGQILIDGLPGGLASEPAAEMVQDHDHFEERAGFGSDAAGMRGGRFACLKRSPGSSSPA